MSRVHRQTFSLFLFLSRRHTCARARPCQHRRTNDHKYPDALWAHAIFCFSLPNTHIFARCLFCSTVFSFLLYVRVSLCVGIRQRGILALLCTTAVCCCCWLYTTAMASTCFGRVSGRMSKLSEFILAKPNMTPHPQSPSSPLSGAHHITSSSTL